MAPGDNESDSPAVQKTPPALGAEEGPIPAHSQAGATVTPRPQGKGPRRENGGLTSLLSACWREGARVGTSSGAEEEQWYIRVKLDY